MKYRKKPVEIEARQWDGFEDTAKELIEWMRENGTNAFYQPPGNWNTDMPMPVIIIETLEGPMETKPFNYIIEGVKKEYYPCDSDIFDMTYERSE